MYEETNRRVYKRIGTHWSAYSLYGNGVGGTHIIMEAQNKAWDIIENVIKVILEFAFGLFHKKLEEKMFRAFMQFVKFGIVGASNTIISYVLNVIVLVLLQPLGVSWDFIAGNVVAFVLSVLWSFYWNNKFVFTMQEGEKRSVWKALLKTYIAYGFTGIIVNNILSWLWINVLGISKYIAPLINLIISVPVNFVINKLWAFRTEE